MKTMPVFWKSMRDYRVSIGSMTVVGILMALLDLAIYPSYRDSLSDFDISMFEGFVGAAGSITSPEGFLSGEYFSWVPLLFITVAIIAATGATAGEEMAGTMDVLLSQPVTRQRLLLEKAAGIAVALTLGVALCMPGFIVTKWFVDFPLGNLRIFEALMFGLPVVLLFEAMALWAGVTFRSRSMASMVVIGVLVASYFLQIIGAMADWLDPYRKLSPFYWSDASVVLVHGFAWLRTAGMLAVTAGFMGAALWSFEKRGVVAGRGEFHWPLLDRLRRPPEAANSVQEG